MNNSLFSFSFLLLLKDKNSHLFSAFIFIFIIFILSSVLFISQSIKNDLLSSIKHQPQIVVENQKAGRHIQITEDTWDELLQITGIEKITPQIDGYYYFAQNDSYFNIIGLDDHSEDSITIGNSIKEILNKYYYDDIFNFFYNGEKFPLKINDSFKENTNIISNNLIVMNLENAKSILGLEYNEYSKLFVHVPNDSEVDYIAQQIKEKYPFMKITTKEQILSNTEHLFYYKGGIFMILYVVSLISFFILLYKQVSSVSGKTKKEIAILRSIGYSIQNIISLKLYQNLFISISSFVIGVIFAYVFVFVAQAPLLKNIFLGNNLDITFTPVVDLNVLSILFFFSIVPFIAAILIPSWKVAISETSEVMK